MERDVEKALIRAAVSAGGFALKLAPVSAGLPDRLVILPGGEVGFCELKNGAAGRVSSVQTKWLQRLANMGFKARVARTAAEAEDFVLDIMAEKFIRSLWGVRP